MVERTISRYCPSKGRSHEMTLKDLRSFDCPNIMQHKNKLFETFWITFFIFLPSVIGQLLHCQPIIVYFSSAGRNLLKCTIHRRLSLWFSGSRPKGVFSKFLQAQNRCSRASKDDFNRFLSLFIQCCGSGSGIRCLFDPWIRDPE